MSAMLLKELAFIDLATKHLGFSNSEKKHMKVLVERGCVLSPQLWEMIVEKLTGSKFVNESKYDFEDFSEAKTGSCTSRPGSKGYYSYKGQITGVGGKLGYIRVALYNEYSRSIDFFLLPPDHSCNSYTAEMCPQAAIKFSYSRRDDTYSNGLEQYRVYKVEDVCSKIRVVKNKKAA